MSEMFTTSSLSGFAVGLLLSVGAYVIGRLVYRGITANKDGSLNSFSLIDIIRAIRPHSNPKNNSNLMPAVAMPVMPVGNTFCNEHHDLLSALDRFEDKFDGHIKMHKESEVIDKLGEILKRLPADGL